VHHDVSGPSGEVLDIGQRSAHREPPVIPGWQPVAGGAHQLQRPLRFRRVTVDMVTQIEQ
jgi:hypothetical protein